MFFYGIKSLLNGKEIKNHPLASVENICSDVHEIKSIFNENEEKNHPVACVEFCEVWDVPEQCEDHHWNDVDCTGEACEPEAREDILNSLNISN